MDREERAAVIRARLLALATLVTGTAYLVWLVDNRNPSHAIVGAVFVAAELACLALFLTASFTVWCLRYKPPEGLPPDRPFDVDVFVPVCGEPAEIVRATLARVSDIQWNGRLMVYVLDDGGSEPVRELAQAYGFRYLSRMGSDHPLKTAKAGNLNFGLSHSDGEFILVLDADEIPKPRILDVLAGYMRFAKVAFIQSKQFFWVPEGDPFFSLDRVFYDAVQLGYDNYDNAISCGSGVLYRRAALKENNGFSSWNIVEDLTTSYDLHSLGWKSFYYPHAVTAGLAPSDVWGVYRQRGQWALDTMRLFFWDNPLFKRGLAWSGRMSYLVIPLSYLSAGFVFPFFFAIPVWTYLTGGSILAGSELEFVVIRGIYFVTMALALRSLFRKHEAGRQFQMLAGLFPVYLLGTLRALIYPGWRKPEYIPNNQQRSRPRGRPAILAVLPQLVLLLANAALPFYAIVAGAAPARLIVANAFVSALAIWSLMPAVLAALGRKTWNEEQSPYGIYRSATESRP